MAITVAVFTYRAVAVAAESAPGRPGSPAAIDVADLDEAGVRAAPPEVFTAMSEQEATAQASMAMSNGDPNKAQAVLDRFDSANAADADDRLDDGSDPALDQATADDTTTAEENFSDRVTRTTTGVVDAFTAEETTEEDIGGYYYDIAFILNSLRSRAFLLVGLFMAVLAGTFVWLSQGGIGGSGRTSSHASRRRCAPSRSAWSNSTPWRR